MHKQNHIVSLFSFAYDIDLSQNQIESIHLVVWKNVLCYHQEDEKNIICCMD